MKNGILSKQSVKLHDSLAPGQKFKASRQNLRLEMKRKDQHVDGWRWLRVRPKFMSIYTHAFLSAFFLKDANRILTRTHHVELNQSKVL